MAAHTNGTQVRLKNVAKYLSLATPLLDDLCDAFGSPLLKSISTITLSLAGQAENIKRNKEDCVRLMEQVHPILCAIIDLHVKSDSGNVLPPATLDHLGAFVQTLQKIHTYLEAQQDRSRIKQLFHQNTTRALLQGCEAELRQVLVAFQVQNALDFASGINEMQKNMQAQHEGMLALISACSTRPSSINAGIASWDSSSSSLSMLPAAPKIFHGRDTELNQVLDILAQPSARVAILGAGGIGKTSLAKMLLHHPTTVERYHDNRFFVSCDSVTTNIDLASLIASSHLGFKLASAGKAIKKVVQHFSEGPPCLVVLDNMETAWEPLQSRGGIEEFLYLLTDVPHLALIVTMRGAERPAKVRWTRPFLRPLQPLTQEAARQTFFDIADDGHDPRDVDELLALTDNLALAVDLIARLVDYEGCPTVLSRWSKEKTQLLSETQNQTKTTSLEVSIMLSLHSPRMSALPGTKPLLSLLSVLPDGISDTDLLQSAPNIPDILSAKTALLRTSLAYLNHDGQLKVLAPIREYISSVFPPSASLVFSVREHLHGLLKLYKKYRGFLSNAQLLDRIVLNLGNLQNMLVLALKNPENYNKNDLEQAVECGQLLGRFCHFSGRGRNVVMEYIPSVLPSISNPRPHVRFLADSFIWWRECPIPDPEALIARAEELFPQLQDNETKCIFHNAASFYYMEHNNDLAFAMKLLETALTVSRSCGDIICQVQILDSLSWTYWRLGNYQNTRKYASEASALAAASGDMHAEARALRMEAVACVSLGAFRDGVQLCSRSRGLLDRCGHGSESEAHDVLMNTEAELHMYKSEYLEARQIHARIVQEVSKENSPYNYALALQNVAAIDVMIGAEAGGVIAKLDEAGAIFNAMGHPTGILFSEIIQADLALRERSTSSARAQFEKGFDLAWRKNDEFTAICLQRLGDVNLWNTENWAASSR
ncbi:hypothetical protein C8R45DRAFT_1107256 [Mycena sanguinolenta]|nr:hypothetical protein C8R45DRAFT_1107256 [Mycena sanguinolenta]